MLEFLIVIALFFFAYFCFKRAIYLKNKQGGWIKKPSNQDEKTKNKTSRKKAEYQCPLCYESDTVRYIHDFNAEYDYPYRQEATIIKKTPCNKCKTELTVVVYKSGSVHAYDDAWEEEKKNARIPLNLAVDDYEEAENDLDEAEIELEDLKEELVDASENETAEIKDKINQLRNSIPELKKKVKSAEKVMEREELKFEKFEDRYSRKQDKFL